MASIHDIRIEGINGSEFQFDQFQGRKLLIVNVASACGFTPQYEQLEQLYRHYADRMAIVGCPCDDYGRQEPGTAEEIFSFCRTMYDVTFPLTQKINIRTHPVHPLYAWLTRKEFNKVSDSVVTWNFQKFAIGPKGEWQNVFTPETSPLDEQVINWIEAA